MKLKLKVRKKWDQIQYSEQIPETFPEGNVMNDEQKAAYQQLLKKRSETLKKTSTDQAKKYANIQPLITGP
jgi:hypothetical protein